MLAVGLTGGIAGGKSTVAGYLSEMGAVCADADVLAREITLPGTGVYDRLVDYFGPDILAPDDSIDRARLASLVFDDPDRLEALNSIVHPAVIARVASLIADWRRGVGNSVAVVQAPLLIEAGMKDMFDVIVVVVSTPEQQVGRLVRMGYGVDEGLARLRSQLSDGERLPFADFTLINKGDLDLLREETAVLYEKLKELA